MAMANIAQIIAFIKVNKMAVTSPALFVENCHIRAYPISAGLKVENIFVVSPARPSGEIANYIMAITT